MAQAPNKLYNRAEIRNILTELSNDWARMVVEHRDAYRHDASHVEMQCKTCIEWHGRVEGLRSAVVHFGGHRA